MITETQLYHNAKTRISQERALWEYYDLLIEYEWDNQEEHLQWVASAPTDELLSWCKTIRAGEPERNKISPSQAAAALGSMTSEKKAAAARENGKRGGRPRKAT